MQGSVINTVGFILYLVYKVQVSFDSNIMVYISLQTVLIYHAVLFIDKGM